MITHRNPPGPQSFLAWGHGGWAGMRPSQTSRLETFVAVFLTGERNIKNPVQVLRLPVSDAWRGDNDVQTQIRIELNLFMYPESCCWSW
jgi:hypothetical protein